ncbi:hypothetical protein [Acrocarpospora catenulata]|uniref:hypothetical protein n=1 Tax=Acrocarpospora catenulata TaxID=2836182 RepID=UPI001BDA4ABD|nr:hypothetical protein [Acrocarpospora catenulata]
MRHAPPRHTTTPPARRAWLAIALALAIPALGACGTQGQRDFVPGGGATQPAETTAETTTVAESTAAAQGAVPGVETVSAGPGLRVDIEWGGKQDQKIRAFTDNFVDQWRAVLTKGTDKSYLASVEEPATRDSYDWVDSFLKDRLSAQGIAKLYSLRVAAVNGRGAEVNACVDVSGVRVTDSTGAPVADQPDWTTPPRSTYLQVAAVRRGDDGTWRVKLFRHASYPDERAKECVR